jgi:hypothetical protein
MRKLLTFLIALTSIVFALIGIAKAQGGMSPGPGTPHSSEAAAVQMLLRCLPIPLSVVWIVHTKPHTPTSYR